jgi:hypothetical protein
VLLAAALGAGLILAALTAHLAGLWQGQNAAAALIVPPTR